MKDVLCLSCKHTKDISPPCLRYFHLVCELGSEAKTTEIDGVFICESFEASTEGEASR